jgi:hypothetical protein
MENNIMDSLNDMSIEDIEAFLAEKTKSKKAQEEMQRVAYNKTKFEMVNTILLNARMIETALQTFHEKTKGELETFRQMMNEYGELKGNSKGGYSVLNEEGTARVRYKFRSLGEYDERSHTAIELISGFFERQLKPADPKMYQLMMKSLQRKEGKLEQSRVAELLVFEAQYDDPDWKRGCELLKESYVVTGTKYYIEVEEKDENGAWRTLQLNLSSI